MIQFDSGRMLAHVMGQFDSIRSAAQAMGVSRRAVLSVLRGKTVTYSTAKKIIDGLGLSQGTDYRLDVRTPANAKKNIAAP